MIKWHGTFEDKAALALVDTVNYTFFYSHKMLALRRLVYLIKFMTWCVRTESLFPMSKFKRYLVLNFDPNYVRLVGTTLYHQTQSSLLSKKSNIGARSVIGAK